ncbi:serine hydrolase domain-containing protein [Gemmatimonas sp.]|uniref:serine hydrolase domain-containing protein n=1 Tax=Gemmatimonas sp. TaxID=1962908 RepID=UPI0025B7F47A|nr:serine hydrolase domain-containing protein [Gemmatimonas sp.]MCA2992662.1 beta-lactamase family protein [Gemmatimonas sp.]
MRFWPALACLLGSASFAAPHALAAQSPLALGKPLAGTVTGKDTARFTLRADSNTVVRLRVDQRPGNVGLRLLGPRNTVVRAMNGSAKGPEELLVITNEAGAYQLQVVAADTTGGAFAVTLLTNERLSTDPKRQVDQLLALWDRRDGPGAAVAVWRGGRTVFAKAYGMANLAYEIPFTVSTPTNIGSTSKQFTAFAVMLLVEEGKLSLDDDVRKHLPELKDFGQVVTVRNLLTHTTGYRELYNSLTLTGRRLDESDYVGREEYIPLVNRQPALQNAPGTEFNYNNTAFGLAAMIVARVSGMPFEAFMAQRVFGPIGLTHTQVRADVRVPVKGATVGYSRSDKDVWRDLGDLGGSMGAGGIYTTLGDLQKWAEHLANPKVGTKASVAQMMTPFTLTDGKSTGYGLGLFVDTQNEQKRVHHGGADVSHRSMLALYPDLNAGITVQSNDGAFDSSIAFRLAEAFFPELAPKPVVARAPFDASKYEAKKFDEFAGQYALDAAPAFVLTFSRAGDTLYTQATGQGKLRLTPTSDTSFAVQGVQASVEFSRDAAKKVNGATLVQNGARQRASRREGPVVAAWAPSATELAAISGRFFSEELETFWDIALVNGTLVAKQRRATDVPLRVTAKDTFTGGAVTLTLERDRVGQVIGFYANVARSRDIRFARVR